MRIDNIGTDAVERVATAAGHHTPQSLANTQGFTVQLCRGRAVGGQQCGRGGGATGVCVVPAVFHAPPLALAEQRRPSALNWVHIRAADAVEAVAAAARHEAPLILV